MLYAGGIFTDQHDDNDIDLIIARRRREARLPEMADPNREEDNEGDW